ncbi:LRR and PYD domains-containing 3-like protein [Labeo rohita]|uniref:LRR and PYD domains-containing 3-like protein n=1 Tax=Labeo rohita TaxID=84645 RepID=A0A498MJX9_LABRO|nr:LRR and PYD domains-containing 3-like protein [Labeo rohita]
MTIKRIMSDNGQSPEILEYKTSIIDSCKFVTEYNLLSGHYIEPVIIQRSKEQIEKIYCQHVRSVHTSGSKPPSQLSSNDENQSIKIDQLFSPDSNGKTPKSVILSGDSGRGKSFMLRKIMLDWASGEFYSKQFDVIFLLKCDEVKCLSDKMSLNELLSWSCSLTSDQISELLQLTPKKVLILIDGTDEYVSHPPLHFMLLHTDPSKRAPPMVILRNLLRGILLPESFTLFTTRSVAADSLMNLKGPQRFTEIMGFSERGVQEYFQNFYQDEKLFRKTYESVKTNESLLTACSVPLLCWMVCFCLKKHFTDDDHVMRELKTTTSIYVHFVSTLLQHHGHRQSVLTMLRSLGQLAEEGMKKREGLFVEKSLIATGLDPATVFLYKDSLERKNRQVSVFKFMHLSFQEFFTGLYYVLLDEEESCGKVTELLNSLKLKGIINRPSPERRSNPIPSVMMFLCGLLNEKASSSLFEMIKWTVPHTITLKEKLQESVLTMRKQHGCELFALHCLYELQDEEFVRRALGDRSIDLSNISLRSTDCCVLLYCLQCCPHIRDMDLMNCALTAEKLKILKPALCMCENMRLSLNSSEKNPSFPAVLNISLTCPQSEISSTDWTLFLQRLSKTGKLAEDSSALDEHVSLLLSSFHSVGLKTLDLKLVSLNESRVSGIISLVQTCTSLQQLSVCADLLLEEGIMLLKKSLTDPHCTVIIERFGRLSTEMSKDNPEGQKRKPQKGWGDIILHYKASVINKCKFVTECSLPSDERVELAPRYTEPVIIQKSKVQNEQYYREHVKSACASGSKPSSQLLSNDQNHSIRIDQLFSPDSDGNKPKTVILSGDSGRGKSFTLQKIMFDWAFGKLYYKNFDVIFLLKCDEVNCLSEEMSLTELLSWSCSLRSDQISQILQLTPENVLILIDGIDEYVSHHSSHSMLQLTNPSDRAQPMDILRSVLKGILLPESFMLVTTRSIAADALMNLLKGPQRFTEIMGFSEREVQEYFQKFFQDEQLFRKTYESVKANESLLAACSVPLLCWMVCFCLKKHFTDDDHVMRELKTTTSIYVHFVSTLLEHHDQSQSVLTMLRSLGQLAEEGVKKREGQSPEILEYKTSIFDSCKFVTEYNLLSDECVDLAGHYTEPVIIQRSKEQIEKIYRQHVRSVHTSGSKPPSQLSSNDKNQSIRIDQLFSPDSDGKTPKSVILSGDSGRGKSFMLQKIMLDWASGEFYSKQFDVIFLLKCDEVKCLSDKMSLNELLSWSCSLTSDQISELLQLTPKKVLILIDGTDEYVSHPPLHFMLLHTDPSKRAPPMVILRNLLRGILLPESFMIVTARSVAADSLMNLKGPQRLTEIMGFSERGVQEYFQMFFKDEQLFRKTFERVKTNENLLTACSVPLLCWMVCFCLKKHFTDDDHVMTELKTTTSIYVHFVSTLLQHHDQIQSVLSLLMNLGQWAERAIQSQQVFFDEKSVAETGLDATIGLFLYKGSLKRKDKQVPMFKFMHFSFQEFFTALYYVLLDDEENNLKVSQLFNLMEWEAIIDSPSPDLRERRSNPIPPVMLFLYGLLNEEVSSSFLEKTEWTVPHTIKLRKKEMRKTLKRAIVLMIQQYGIELFALHCLHELQDKTFVRKILKVYRSLDLYNISLRSTDCWVLLYCLQCCPHIRNLNLMYCDLTVEELKILQPVLCMCENMRLTVDYLYDVGDLIQNLGESKILRKLRLSLSSSEKNPSFPAVLNIRLTCPQSEISSTDWTLFLQRLSKTGKVAEVSSALDEHVSLLLSSFHSVGLKMLDLKVVVLNESWASGTISLVQTCTSLQELSSPECNEQVDALFSFLHSVCDLKSVELIIFSLNHSWALRILTLIQACSSLQEIRTKCSKLTDQCKEEQWSHSCNEKVEIHFKPNILKELEE